MDRIRKYRGKFQVLHSPSQVSNAGFELLRGDMVSFDDSFLRNYSIATYGTLADALYDSYYYAPLDWDSLVLLNKSAFYDLQLLIKEDLNAFNINVQFEPKMMTPLELKETMFNRVMMYGSRFKASYQLNDIISFNIVSMWSRQLDEVASHLVSDGRLRIEKVKKYPGMVTLIGLTDLSMAYEIRLTTTIFDQYYKWVAKYDIQDKVLLDKVMKKCLKQQKAIDSGIVIR